MTSKLAIVIGSEGKGVREIVKKTTDFLVDIPMRGKVASLNVSVATAIALLSRPPPFPPRDKATPGAEGVALSEAALCTRVAVSLGALSRPSLACS